MREHALNWARSDVPASNACLEREVKKQYIFGATGHIGRSVVKAALAHNDLVTAVGQAYEDTLLSVRTSFPSFPDHCLPLLCDVRIRSTVDGAIQQSIVHWGRVDVIANCSGYGVIGACEDQDDYDIRNQFETNFFGTLNIIDASLPYFRSRHQSRASSTNEPGEYQSPDEPDYIGGRYLIFTSTSGALGVPGLGPYSATKHAVEGLVESMLYETNAFNIKATLVEPGHLRQDDADTPTSSDVPPDSTFPVETAGQRQIPHSRPFTHFQIKQPLPTSAYADPTAPAGHARRMVQWLGGNNRQPTSTVRSAELVWQLGHCRFPPLRLLLGEFAVESVRDRLRCVIEEIEDWKHLGFGEDTGGREEVKIKEEQMDDDDDDGMEGDEDWEMEEEQVKSGDG
ncbi:MAG: hypothetical protein Q9181_006541 [Wetmoreana brouardii]